MQTQRDWIGNYQHCQEQGYPVGSGLVEQAVAVGINMRMEKRRMRWKRANATAVVALRVEPHQCRVEIPRCLAPDSWWTPPLFL